VPEHHDEWSESSLGLSNKSLIRQNSVKQHGSGIVRQGSFTSDSSVVRWEMYPSGFFNAIGGGEEDLNLRKS
jgi:hypothetical protein